MLISLQTSGILCVCFFYCENYGENQYRSDSSCKFEKKTIFVLNSFDRPTQTEPDQTLLYEMSDLELH